jgi:hypothetical protein
MKSTVPKLFLRPNGEVAGTTLGGKQISSTGFGFFTEKANPN